MSRFSEQQIAVLLKQVDDGVSVAEVCRKAGISQQAYYRWRTKYGGLRPSEVRRLKQAAQIKRIRKIAETHVRYGYWRIHVLLQ